MTAMVSQLRWTTAALVVCAGCGDPASTGGGDSTSATGSGAATTHSGGDGVGASGAGAGGSGDGGENAGAGTGAGASGVGAGGGGGSGGEGGSGGGSGCVPLRTYTHALSAPVALSCVPGGSPSTVFDVSIPDQGRALVRLNLNLVGAGASSAGVHGWSANIQTGDPSFGDIINFGAGEDLCPGEAMSRSMLGYGELTALANQVTVVMHQYRDTACVDGTVTIAAGSSIEVWVEDPDPACVETSIVARSYFRTIWNQFGAGANVPIAMTTSFSEVLEASIAHSVPSDLLVLSQLEISPASTANLCNNRFQTAVAAITQAGSYLTTQELGYPQSGGQTHVLLSPSLSISGAAGPLSTFAIAAAVNQNEQIGAPVGTTSSGDTVLAIVVP